MSTLVNDALPYGVRDIKLTKYLDALGMLLDTTSVDLPYIQRLNFTEAEEFSELRGDDKTITTRGKGSTVNWDLESGGIAPYAWAVFTGGTVDEVIVGSDVTELNMHKRSTTARPWFRIDGRIISDSGGDVLVRIYRCRANGDITSNFQDGEFTTTAVTGVGYPLLDDANDLLYSIFRRGDDSAVSLTLTPDPNPLAAPLNVTVGNVTASSAEVTWGSVPNATSYKVESAVGPAYDTWTAVSPDPTTTTATLSGLSASKTYKVRVTSKGASSATSLPSIPVTFNTPAS